MRRSASHLPVEAPPTTDACYVERMQVLYEDEQVVAVDKPAGVPTIPDRFGSDSVQAMLERERGEKLWVVHRLDREVTGVLVFARDASAHRQLSIAFERHDAKKEYEALSEGDPPGPPGKAFHWENRLLRGKKRSYPSPHGKLAITDAIFLGELSHALHWRLAPRTGRNHQLRVHLAHAGFPILGDTLYGAHRRWHDGIALRAVRLTVGDLDISAPTLSA